MGKKPLVGLVGLFWAGMALTGCGECSRSGCRDNKYNAQPMIGGSARTNQAPATPGAATGMAKDAGGAYGGFKESPPVGGAPLTGVPASKAGMGDGMMNTPGSPAVGAYTPPGGAGPMTTTNSLRPVGDMGGAPAPMGKTDEYPSTTSPKMMGTPGSQPGASIHMPPPPARRMGGMGTPDSGSTTPSGPDLSSPGRKPLSQVGADSLPSEPTPTPRSWKNAVEVPKTGADDPIPPPPPGK